MKKEKAMKSRQCISDTYLTQFYLLKGESQSMSAICKAALIIKHILTECTYLSPQRHRFYKEKKIKKLFKNDEIDKIIPFPKRITIYRVSQYTWDPCDC